MKALRLYTHTHTHTHTHRYLKENHGITLVALVVTIVVLLILAGVTINLVVGQNGLINRAKEAAKNTTLASLIDEVQTEIVAEQTKVKTMEFLNTNLKDVLDRYFENVPESYYLKSDTVLKTKAEYGNYEIKLSEICSQDFSENETTDCTVYTDVNGKKAPIPTGFTVSTVEGENLVDKGLVIKEDSTGNEYVWIPCAMDGSDKLQYQRTRWNVENDNETEAWKDELTLTDSNVTYLKTDTDNGINEEVSKEIVKQINSEFASVKKYGGYYIGRYEVGVEDEKVVIKSNKEVCSKQTWSSAYSLSKEIGDGTSATTYLCSSYAWDTAINFIMNNGATNYATSINGFNENWINQQVVDSNGYVIKEAGVGKKLLTGQTGAKSNIFDMGGNVVEYTTELNIGVDDNVIFRGGSSGLFLGAAGNRWDATYIQIINNDTGFRATLFLK